MARETTKGKCSFCHAIFSKGTIARHLASCPQRANKANTGSQKKTKVFHLVVDGRDNPQYWMHINVPAEATLSTLDDFLRDTWVECCGHLSNFEFAGTTYASSPDSEFGDKSMRIQVGKLLSPGQQFSYEYDYGTTTELRLKVVSEGEEVVKEKSIQILARNEPPAIACDKCGKPAEQVCCECVYGEGGWLCNDCAETHECGEDMLLPVVNSPRVGMCGFTG
jgi:Plasmid pRiA4b ORF-3-like protein